MHRAIAALHRLQEGNDRFASGEPLSVNLACEERRAELVGGQEPFAVILGCSDSRVPAEIVFDQGLGDLFVIRVAGNVTAPSGVGSVEFAVENCGTRLIVVLGHSDCGAVKATIDQLVQPPESRSKNLESIVNRISPSAQPFLEDGTPPNQDELVEKVVRANIRSSANHLRHGSPILEDWVEKDGLLIVGAEYSLATGKVDFFDGIPDISESS
ncbi:MAG: carbonic anhydrase [Verrucomicrobiales bacterium]|nr:carbonic anhydrase [Verrucomicrobiales bacterium]